MSATHHRSHAVRAAAARPLAEPLEGRRLMTVSVDAANVVTITGTDGGDVLHPVETGGNLVVRENGVVTLVRPLSRVARVVLVGNGGNDTLVGTTRADQLFGGPGDDRLVGGDGDDLLDGGNDNDTLIGEFDDDTLIGGFGSDDLQGGPGTDLADFSGTRFNQSLSIDGVRNDGVLIFSDLDNIRTDVENVRGGGGNDVILGSTAANTLYGGGGDDRLVGGDDADVLSGEDGNDTLIGEFGDDTLRPGFGTDDLFGGPGRDAADYRERNTAVFLSIDGIANDGMSVADERDNIRHDVEDAYGGAGNDLILGSVAANRLFGMGGHDRLVGGDDADRLEGGDGNDQLLGEFGDDSLVGGAGGDDLQGGPGADEADYRAMVQNLSLSIDGVANDGPTLFATKDNIRLDVERVSGGSGSDVITGSAADDQLYGMGGNDAIDGLGGNDTLVGSAGNDKVRGGSGLDTLDGGEGNDDLYGEADDDRLFGGPGLDGLTGGLGTDTFTGGAGNDRFLLRASEREILVDLAGNEAWMQFSGTADRAWTDREIERVDAGLGWLHRRTRNGVLLGRAGGGRLTFQRAAADGASLADNNSQGLIRFFDRGFTESITPAMSAVHEVGHNWDTEDAHGAGFLQISGWRSWAVGTAVPNGFVRARNLTGVAQPWVYRSGSTFARSYGKTNPNEDFATALEGFYDASQSNAAGAWQAKWNFVRNWLSGKTT